MSQTKNLTRKLTPIYHFKADKVVYHGGILMQLLYKPNRLNAKILSDIQYYKYTTGSNFEVIEIMKKGNVKYK